MRMEWVIAAVLAVAVLLVVALYNRLVRHRNLVREGWSGIDVQLRRRTDLIPNLVETVKGYAAHERSAVRGDHRASAHRASRRATCRARPTPSATLQGSLGRLIAVAEAYPELKADQNFLELQEQLAEIEDQLQMARRYYNGTVRDLNIAIQSFPDVLVARPLGFQRGAVLSSSTIAPQAAAQQVAFPGRKP